MKSQHSPSSIKRTQTSGCSPTSRNCKQPYETQKSMQVRWRVRGYSMMMPIISTQVTPAVISCTPVGKLVIPAKRTEP